jgi:ribosomal protein L20
MLGKPQEKSRKNPICRIKGLEQLSSLTNGLKLHGIELDARFLSDSKIQKAGY